MEPGREAGDGGRSRGSSKRKSWSCAARAAGRSPLPSLCLTGLIALPGPVSPHAVAQVGPVLPCVGGAPLANVETVRVVHVSVARAVEHQWG
jgi:hypothetical protein